MDIFKFVYLKKKGKLDEKGAALANVMLISVFVMVLSSSIMSMAYSSYRMKLINLNSKDNFYSCEAVLDQIKVGFRNEMSDIMMAQLGTSDETEVSEEDMQKVFKTFYEKYKSIEKVSTDQAITSDGIYYYDLYKVARLLTSIAGIGGSNLLFPNEATVVNSVNSDGYRVYSSEVKISVKKDNGTFIYVTLMSEAEKTNNFELTDSYVVFRDLSVIYSEDGYENKITTDIRIGFPAEGSGNINSPSGNSGWVTLLAEKIKPYGDWQKFFSDINNKNHDFGYVCDPDSNTVYVNTTDYPANSISDIIFEMQRYVIYYHDEWYANNNKYVNCYEHLPVYPILQVQDGLGTGQQYAPCGKDDYENVYVFVGGDDEDDSSWVKYTDVFDNNCFVKAEGRNNPDSAVSRYISYYGDDLNKSYDRTESRNDVAVKYKVHLTDKNGLVNSRGWIMVTGGVMGNYDGKIRPYLNNNNTSYVKLYVNKPAEYTDPTIIFEASDFGNGEKNGYIFLDLRNTGYSVGDVLKVTIKNVNPDHVMNPDHWFSIQMQVESIFGQQYSNFGELKYGEDYYVDYEKNSTQMDVYITMKWSTYPFLKIYFRDNSNKAHVQADIDVSWYGNSSGSNSSGGGTSLGRDPMISYQNWRKE